jgi:hypothetical protein
MVEEGGGRLVLMDVVECYFCPVLMAELPSEAESTPVGIYHGGPDSKLTTQVGGGGVEGEVEDISEAVVYPLVEMLVINVKDGSGVEGFGVNHLVDSKADGLGGQSLAVGGVAVEGSDAIEAVVGSGFIVLHKGGEVTPRVGGLVDYEA